MSQAGNNMESQRTQAALALLILSFYGFILAVNSVQYDDLSFLVVGDWGGLNFFPYKTPVESAVAKQMGKTADEIGAQFVVALGM